MLMRTIIIVFSYNIKNLPKEVDLFKDYILVSEKQYGLFKISTFTLCVIRLI
ncbi:hypothetical protein F945_02741 [Acinetobacter rudis CIP 110305]|uniref:Uncharacterized protein n=1 Tax=Acinetobacter rudis CIP 110305 TaxID=421052 RepID=S3MX16_9GAMM|nr:hypothetical protein F945_02741 [Acinetobacter rudis CIP 110305]